VIGWLIVVALGAAMLIPNGFVAVGTRAARSCIRGYESPRGPEVPWCGDAMRWFSFPARVPWTVTPATYRAEELRIRIAIGYYQNATFGVPDKDARAKASELMKQANEIVRTGSQRLAFEELGPAVGAPDPAKDALLAGDRDTLLAHAKEHGEWHLRLHTLEASLLEGDFARTLDIARHYATYDPREEDLRSAVGAILCMGGDVKRGTEMFLLQQNDRASRRYAAMSRNWGDVRTALLACAALGKVAPPPRPPSNDAGQDDRREARAPVRLRLAEDVDNHLREAQESAAQMLQTALPAGARAPILASLLASGHDIPAETWADFVVPRAADGEGPLLDLGSVNVLSWLDQPADRPIAVGSVYRRGAQKLVEIAASGPEEVRPALEAAAGALWIEGARAYVREGDGDAAVELLSKAAPLVGMDATTRALAEGLARYATGDAEAAHSVLSKAAAAASEDVDADPELRAALLTLRAETSGVWGPPSQEEAFDAYEHAMLTNSAALEAWARRVRFWAAPWTEPPSDVKVESVDPVAGRFAVWPSLGYANRLVQWDGANDERLEILGRNLGVWSAVLRASESEQRAFRYAFMRQRGDVPDAMVPYLAIAGSIAGEGGDPEVWLDAVMAADAPKFSMRAYAWARAQVARARGDKAAHKLWTERFKTLAKIAGDEGKAELARMLGI
jgi:hypothetical protein